MVQVISLGNIFHRPKYNLGLLAGTLLNTLFSHRTVLHLAMFILLNVPVYVGHFASNLTKTGCQ